MPVQWSERRNAIGQPCDDTLQNYDGLCTLELMTGGR